MRLIMALASWFYVGYLPVAPGTWGSLAALPLHFLLIRFQPAMHALSIGIITLVAIFVAGSAEKILDHKDPGIVVIDEVAGMLITLYLVPDSLFYWVVGFFIFRFFDILKPFPIRWIDQHLNGGLGIVMDDVLAGFYSLAVLWVITWLVNGT